MNPQQPLRVVFLAQDEAPPAAVVQLLQHPSMASEGCELEAFFAALELGSPVPDLLVGVGGEQVVRALRRNGSTACLPLFRWGSTETVPPGWDGSLVRWNEARLSDVALWLQRLHTFPPVAEPEQDDRREHRFLRLLATRGAASLSDAEVFGVKAPGAALRRWKKRGWCTGTAQHLQATSGLLKVVGRERLDFEDGSALPGRTALQAFLQEPAAPAAPPRRPSRRAWLTIAGLLLLVVFLLDPSAPSPKQRQQQVQELEPITVGASLPSLPELFLDARLVRPQVEISASLDGRIAWNVAQDASVLEGAKVGTLTWVSDSRPSQRLQQLVGELEQEMSLQQQQAQRDWSQELETGQKDAQAQASMVSALERRLPGLQEDYDRTRRLAEQGILSFREVRPDWDALLAVEEDLDSARMQLQDLQRQVEILQQAGPPDLSQQGLWKTRTQTLQVQLEEARATLVQVPVLAEVAGEFRPLVTTGELCRVGQVIAQLTPQDAGFLEAVLATPDWNPAYLVGNARLRRPGRSSWLPTRILSASSEPDGLTRLRLRLPVGWLDDSMALADADHRLLELRLTAPAPAVESLPGSGQPQPVSPVESPR